MEKNTKGDATRRLFDTGPQDAGSPLPLIDAKRAQARADSQGSTVGRAPPRPPSGRPQSPDQDEGEDGPVRRRLAFNRIEADARSGLTPLELNTPIGGAPARRALVIGAAIVVFVGMNAALLGYLPFVEHRATPPLRGLELDTRRETAPATAAPPPAPGPAAPTPPALRPATPAPAPLSAPAPVQEARASVSPPRAEPGPSAPPPQPRPVPSPVLTARAAPSPAARPAPAPPTIARTPAAAPSAAAGPTAPSGLAVQVGAFKSAALAEEALAKAEAAAGAAPVALSHRQESVTKDGKTLVRALLVGFSTPQQAIRYCQTLQQSGGACFVRR